MRSVIPGHSEGTANGRIPGVTSGSLPAGWWLMLCREGNMRGVCLGGGFGWGQVGVRESKVAVCLTSK